MDGRHEHCRPAGARSVLTRSRLLVLGLALAVAAAALADEAWRTTPAGPRSQFPSAWQPAQPTTATAPHYAPGELNSANGVTEASPSLRLAQAAPPAGNPSGGGSLGISGMAADVASGAWIGGAVRGLTAGSNGLERLPPTGELPAPPPPGNAGPARMVIPLAGSQPTPNVQVKADEGGVSLVVRDGSLAETLTLLAQAQGMNLVLASPADVRITVSLDHLPLEEALDSILAAGGYHWMRRGNVIFVTAVGAESTVAPSVQGRRLEVFELDYASAADVDLAVKGLLSPVGKSWLSQSSPTDNRRTKEVIAVEDLPAYLQRIGEYVSQVDIPPRQVMIQVHVLEVDLKNEQRHGVNFEHLAKFAGTELTFKTQGFANATAPQAFFLELDSPNLGALIEALKTSSDAKTLASPRVLALNGQESRMQVGQQLGFRVTTTTQTSTLESVEFLDVGVVLRVTPRIARDGRVMMRIKPEVSTGTVNPDTGLPEEETTEVETDVLLENGQGMIIGGLIKETDSTTTSKVGSLGDLKYVGALFQRRQASKNRSEIIVALIPHVLPLPGELQARNDSEWMRVTDPLVHGPLCRYPRPYEPRLPDAFDNPRRLRDDPCRCLEPAAPGSPCAVPGYAPPFVPAGEAVPAPLSYPQQPPSSPTPNAVELLPSPNVSGAQAHSNHRR